MSGFWNLSHVQQFDLNSKLLDGVSGREDAWAYFYEGGTTTPMPTYQDAGLALLHPFPVVSVGGRFPAVFFDDVSFSFYGVKITTSDGVETFFSTTEPIIGQQVGSGGSEVPVDLNSTLQTGEIFCKHGVGSRAGAVRLGGRTIGSATSGATERANADTQSLFLYLWGQDVNLVVSGTRGVSSAADWAANKTIALPDWRRAFPAGLSDMGNSALAGISGGATLGRGTVGEETHALVLAELAAHTHADGTLAAAAHTHFTISNTGTLGVVVAPSAANYIQKQGGTADNETYILSGSATAATLGLTSSNGADVTGATASSGSGTAHNTLPPFARVTWYMRL